MIGEIKAQEIRKFANKQNVLRRAVDYLLTGPKSDPAPDDTVGIDPDWLDQFSAHAEKASSDKVRDLSAKVLSGEIRHPGSFSLMTLRFLAEMDQHAASWFQEEVEFRIEGEYILVSEKDRGERLSRFIFLEQAGLLFHTSPIGGIARYLNPEERGFAWIFEEDLCLRIHLDNSTKLEDVVYLTHVGREVATILPPVDPRSVFKRLTRAVYDKAKAVDICRVLEKDQDNIWLSDPIEILKPMSHTK